MGAGASVGDLPEELKASVEALALGEKDMKAWAAAVEGLVGEGKTAEEAVTQAIADYATKKDAVAAPAEGEAAAAVPTEGEAVAAVPVEGESVAAAPAAEGEAVAAEAPKEEAAAAAPAVTRGCGGTQSGRSA